jgi:NADP-dependent 3-hydroxy acid dehydrogenase YdfG
MAMPPEAIAEAVAYSIGQPEAVDVGEITVRPTVQP